MTLAPPHIIAGYAAGAATGVGLLMWIWAGLFSRNPLRRIRMTDAGMVLIFSAILVRIVIKPEPLNALDWILGVLAPLFILAALYRLWRTQTTTVEDER